MPQVAEAEDDDESHGDVPGKRPRELSNDEEGSLSEGKNDVSCFLDILHSNNSNDESGPMHGNRPIESENSCLANEPDLKQQDPSQCMAVGPEDETMNLIKAISMQLASTFE